MQRSHSQPTPLGIVMCSVSLLVALTGCAVEGAAGEEAGSLLTGTVTSVDRSPMAYDGDAVVVLDVDGEPVQVRIPARINLCPARDRIELGDVQVGDRVEVLGARGEDNAVRACAEPNHLLRRVR